jgi:SAM-dependent methyltransferase
LQYLAVQNVLENLRTQEMRMLHFAPEECFRAIFSRRFPKYETADLFMDGVDHKVDIRNLPFEDESYDIIFASHVLEHIRDDRKVVQEIRRVLKTNGIAILPVPIVSTSTIEYPEPNPHEAGHVRSPGVDYFDRYREYFGRVDVHASEAYPERNQVFIYEDRSLWPTKECPLRPPMQGERHSDFVPVCYV